MSVIALNDIGEQFERDRVSLRAYSLKQAPLVKHLEKLEREITFTPMSKAYSWDSENEWQLDPKQSSTEGIAGEILKNIKVHLEQKQ